MHNSAIEARTKLRLDAETERQRQELADIVQEKEAARRQRDLQAKLQESQSQYEIEVGCSASPFSKLSDVVISLKKPDTATSWTHCVLRLSVKGNQSWQRRSVSKRSWTARPSWSRRD